MEVITSQVYFLVEVALAVVDHVEAALDNTQHYQIFRAYLLYLY